jgi:hypothetical protein
MAVSDEILTGQLKVANLVLGYNTALQNGALNVNWDAAIKGNRSVLAVQNRYNLGDTSSATFQRAYACLNGFVGQYAGGPIDPNAQNPGVVIDVNQLVNFNQAIIPFTNQSPVQLSNYNTTYQQLYGANPFLAIYLNTNPEQEDESTPPQLTRATPGDPSSELLNILWDYPFPVSGYIQISGIAPGSGGSGGGSAGSNNAVNFTYDQTALVYDGANDQWFLPLMLPTNKIPVYFTVNGVSSSGNFDRNFTPTRLYSFADNTVSQAIVVTILTVS